MSRLIVNQIQGDAVSKEIEIPTGHKLIATDASSIVSPGTPLQIATTKWYSNHDTTSTSFVVIDVTDSYLTFTPKRPDSKLYIQYHLHYYTRTGHLHGIKPYYNVASVGSDTALTSSSTFNEVTRVSNGNSGFVMWSMASFDFLVDMLGTGSEAITLKVYHRSSDGNSVRINDNGPGSSITVTEIAQ